MTHLVSKMQFQQPTFKLKCSFQRKREMHLPLRKTQTNGVNAVSSMREESNQGTGAFLPMSENL